jgi:hypothetical protein
MAGPALTTPSGTALLDRLFSPFGGDQQGIGHRLLSDAYSPAGSQNVWIDKLGHMVAGGDFVIASSSLGGAVTERITGLFFFANVGLAQQTLGIGTFEDAAGLTWYVRYLVVNATWSVTGPWVNLVSIATGAPNNTVPDFAQLGDQLFLTTGAATDGPRVINFGGGGPPPTAVFVGSTQLAAPVPTLVGVGVLNGIYQWKVVPIKNDNARKVGSVTSAADFQVVNQQTSLAWVADADVTVSGYEIYRTTGSGKTFWRVAYVDGRLTVAYVDNVDDKTILQDIVLELHGDAPPIDTFYCETHKGRMWWGRVNNAPRRVYYSDPGVPDSVNVLANYIDFTDAQNTSDYITGMTGNYKDMLVVWLHDSVWTISGTGQILSQVVDWNRERSNARTGCIGHRTALKIPKGAHYTDESGQMQVTEEATLAFMTPLGDIRLFDGLHDYVISYPKKDLLAAEALTNLQQAEGVYRQAKQHAFLDETRGLAIWYIFNGGATIQTAVVWNYRLGTWHEFSGQTFNAVVAMYTRTEGVSLVAGEARTATGSATYRLYTGGGGQNGAVLPTRWISAPLRFGAGDEPDSMRVKRYRWTEWFFKKMAAPLTLTVEAIPGDTDDADVTTAAALMSFTVSTTGRTEMKKLQTAAGKYVHDRGMRLRCTQSSTSGIWTLEYLRIVYQVLHGIKHPG